MRDLQGELRRLGLAGSRINGEMLKAERREYDNPRPPPVIRKVVLTMTTAQEKALAEQMGIIATAFRKGQITEEQARMLVERVKV